MSRLAIAILFGVLSLVQVGCFKIGNDIGGTCKPGKPCVCDIIGNCTKSCPSGGCQFECSGTSNCIFDCAAGDCETLCANTGMAAARRCVRTPATVSSTLHATWQRRSMI